MTNPITKLSDAGHHPAAIAKRLDVSLSTVYATLRRERPDRPRKPRPATSDLPRRIRILEAKGYKRARIATLLQVSRAYVYKVLATEIDS